MIKLMYKLGWAIVCSILCCGFITIAVTAIFQQGHMPDRTVFMFAVVIGSVLGIANTLLIAMAEALGFWSSLSIKPYVFSGTTFGLLMGLSVSGLGLVQALGLGILVSVATSIGSYFGIRAAIATQSK